MRSIPRTAATAVVAMVAALTGSVGAAGGAHAATTAEVGGNVAATRCLAAYPQAPTGPDRLSPCQWDMGVIDAAGAWSKATGRGVRVGVIDGGVDFTHADLQGAIDVAASCSFITSSTPTADPREIADGDCSNKAAVQDLQGHGTHVATTIAGRRNGVGIVGVAPEATIVGLKACTVAGYCFADSVAAGLRYAGDQRLDVVNLSLFADPYLYYCKSDAEQRAILQTLAEAARYAQQRGVVIVAAAGNEAQDLGHPVTDTVSPDWPPGSEVTREVGNECRVAPAELPGVITVSATGVNQPPATPTSARRSTSPLPVVTAGNCRAPSSAAAASWPGGRTPTPVAPGRRRPRPTERSSTAGRAMCGSAARRWPRRMWPASRPWCAPPVRVCPRARSRRPSGRRRRR